MSQKRAKNLLLDQEALNSAESYCHHHHTTLSRLVEDFLFALPSIYAGGKAESAIVRRLAGAAMYGPMVGDSYRDYLHWKRYEKFADDE